MAKKVKKEKPKEGEIVEASKVTKELATQTAEQGRKDAAIAIQSKSEGWGLPTHPGARKALMAITAFYGLDAVMGDILILGGSTLYVTEQAYKKKLDETAIGRFGGKPFHWKKRPATSDECRQMGYIDIKNSRVWYVELFAPDNYEQPITCAYGQADPGNMTLINASKKAGDPRILNRMAIKRAQHECMRDIVVFRLPAAADFEAKMGMKYNEFLESGVDISLDDGILTAGQQEEARYGKQGPGSQAKGEIDGGPTEDQLKDALETEFDKGRDVEPEPEQQEAPQEEQPEPPKQDEKGGLPW